ncbi:alpha-mannosidase 2x-like [Mya arenaria]|uniref:alpha-mannosidase 2x-like n=1 Tax=Mya arenaria TaxID=6604 RepID=UPI0022E5566A|nr:alpha-mannosidase 2x-like [Mya arenaria]XP_052768638.1 alpha-mannosidase 2x-like [Mya arenaria]XP_052768639.1 alpha-mannosidase 2x-like [Mya arenaria]XP_052768640.1 alpha-mannosidase 2x-like [Mya arenaria]
MMFPHQTSMSSTATILSVLFVLLVYSQGSMHVPQGHPSAWHRRRALLVDYEFEQQQFEDNVNAICEKQVLSSENTADNSTIFTIDLPVKTNFKTYSNKQYSLPHPRIEYDNHTKLNVVIVPHSHVDAGWLQTVEEYYVHHVKGILNNMVIKLGKYEDMRFVWAETVFLSMWWNDLDDDVKHKVRKLIKRGQLEIALGGWVMSDEASTHYVSVIDQLTEGHQWVIENLHVTPTNSWAIDPFGHSATMPYLWKQAGMENMVIQRVHQAIKATLAGQKALEFHWRQMWDYKGDTDILCHIMPYIYYGAQHSCGPNRQICAMYDYGIPKSIFEQTTGRKVTEQNIETQARYLYEQYRLKAGLFKYDTVLVPLGDDFRFDTAEEWDLHYVNYKKIMEYINNRPDWNMNVQFGTLNNYFNIVKNKQLQSVISHDKNSAFPVLKGDFFPYSDLDSEYWTGYYSTRPFQKQLSRDVESSLRSADILSTLAYTQCKKLKVEFESYLETMSQLQEVRRSLGLFLHHDAITGTSKPHVVQDYENKLLHAFNTSQEVMNRATQNILTKCNNDDPYVISTHNLRKDAHSSPKQYKTTITKSGSKVIFFNPVAQQRSELVKLRVDTVNIDIRNSQDLNIPFQINPIFQSATRIQSSEFEIVFLVELPPFAIESYTLYRVDAPQYSFWSTVETFGSEKLSFSSDLKFQSKNYATSKSIYKIENELFQANFNEKGMLSSLYDRVHEKEVEMQVDFLSYTSQASGAYLFYPSGEAKSTLSDLSPKVRLIKGPFMEQIQVVYKHLFHAVTLFDTPTVQGQGLHVHNELNMAAKSMTNEEVIMRISSGIKNEHGSFYTDENGYQLIGRQTRFDARVETNYYPVTSMAVIEDRERRFTVHSQQSHGVASLKQGWMEFMLDRNVENDDNRGLGEGVTDNRPTVSHFIIQLEQKQINSGQKENYKYTHPSLSGQVINGHLQQPIQTLFSTVRNDVFLSHFYPINGSLPCDHTVVSFKTLITSDLDYNGTSVILHRKGFSCDFPTVGLQCPAQGHKVTLQTLFPEFSVIDARETTLTHLHTKSYLSLDKSIDIQSNEIKSFVVTL